MMEHNQGSESVGPRSPDEEKLVSILEGIRKAIIFSAKHVGHWDDNLTERVMKGESPRMVVDLASLEEALSDLIREAIEDFEKWGNGGELPVDVQTGKTNIDYYFEEKLKEPEQGAKWDMNDVRTSGLEK
jgi:Ni/Co efflux regulator RcnB